MLDVRTQLALSLANAPGTIAVLVGSGISRAAGIPTGWEVLVDLIGRLAQAVGNERPSSGEAESWFTERFGDVPTYSSVLQAMAPTRDAQLALLSRYFESQRALEDDEIEPGEPIAPTVAHRALASLAAHKLIKVFLTTNFDHLLEEALQDVGVEPRVVAHATQVEGMTPLIHAGCTVIKLNGDYRLGQLLNTDADLRSYQPQTAELLDSVLRDFGVLVVGWSGTWDHAIRESMSRRCPKRYPDYWIRVGVMSPDADALVAHRGMVLIDADSADEVLPKIADTAIGLHLRAAPHPVTEDALVARQARYIRRLDAGRMDRVELVAERRNAICSLVASTPRRDGASGVVESYAEAAQRLDLAVAPDLALIVQAVRHGDAQLVEAWREAIGEVLSQAGTQSGHHVHDLRRYPGICMSYAFGLAALAARDGSLLQRLWTTRVAYDGERATDILMRAGCVRAISLEAMEKVWKMPSGQDYAAPASERIASLLQRHLVGSIHTSAKKYRAAFAQFELLWSVAYTVDSKAPSPARLPFLGIYGYELGRQSLVDEFGSDARWRWVDQSGCVGTSDMDVIARLLLEHYEQAHRRAW